MGIEKEALSHQEVEQATNSELTKLNKKSCKDFRTFLRSILSADQMSVLHVSFCASKHQTTKWLNEPQTMPFEALNGVVGWIYYAGIKQADIPGHTNILELVQEYEIGFDVMTLRHYYFFKGFKGEVTPTLIDFLRARGESPERYKAVVNLIQYQLGCKKHQMTRWLTYPQTMPLEAAQVLVRTLWQDEVYHALFNEHRMTVYEEGSFYNNYQIGYDAITLRQVFELINQQTTD
jgi:hypothetical protein